MAAIEQASCVCSKCGPVMGQRTGINHVLHLILTIFTCFWGIVWIILAVAHTSKPFLCTKCGLPTRHQ